MSGWIVPAWLCFWSFCAPPADQWVITVAPFHTEIVYMNPLRNGAREEYKIYTSVHQAGPFASKAACEEHRAFVVHAFAGEEVAISECLIIGEVQP